MYLISACLLGKNCKYSGGNNLDYNTVAFSERVEHIAVCPEELGGLSTPRTPCEIVEDRVFSVEGADCTAEFKRGAEEVLKLANNYGVERVILKSKSPSCGMGLIYDGSFSKKFKFGLGITAKLLLENNIKVYSENDMRLMSKNFKCSK